MILLISVWSKCGTPFSESLNEWRHVVFSWLWSQHFYPEAFSWPSVQWRHRTMKSSTSPTRRPSWWLVQPRPDAPSIVSLATVDVSTTTWRHSTAASSTSNRSVTQSTSPTKLSPTRLVLWIFGCHSNDFGNYNIKVTTFERVFWCVFRSLLIYT